MNTPKSCDLAERLEAIAASSCVIFQLREDKDTIREAAARIRTLEKERVEARLNAQIALTAANSRIAELEGALKPFLPITVHETPDYAELTFGEHQTQAMTMQPSDWLELTRAALKTTGA